MVKAEELLTTAEAAQRLGKSKEVVLKACQTGQLPAKKLGWQWFIDPADLPKSWPPAPAGKAKKNGRPRPGRRA